MRQLGPDVDCRVSRRRRGKPSDPEERHCQQVCEIGILCFISEASTLQFITIPVFNDIFVEMKTSMNVRESLKPNVLRLLYFYRAFRWTRLFLFT